MHVSKALHFLSAAAGNDVIYQFSRLSGAGGSGQRHAARRPSGVTLLPNIQEPLCHYCLSLGDAARRWRGEVPLLLLPLAVLLFLLLHQAWAASPRGPGHY